MLSLSARLVRWFFTAFIVLVTGLLLIRKLGVDLAPLLAGGTLVGAALGFGAQNLIKDVIAGFFLIIENQIRVGDVAEVNGKSGLVEQLHIRTIVLSVASTGLCISFPMGRSSTSQTKPRTFPTT